VLNNSVILADDSSCSQCLFECCFHAKAKYIKVLKKKINELKKNEEALKTDTKTLKQNKEKLKTETNTLKQDKINLEKEREILTKAKEKFKKKNIDYKTYNEDLKKGPFDLKKICEQKPTLVGLNNIGATCFMNSTLQCLSQTKELTNYFLKAKNKDKIFNNNIALKNRNEVQLSPIYYELIQKLWDKNTRIKYFEPRSFMKAIEQMNPLFKQGQPGDSKDFIIFLLEQFHTELKKSLPKNNTNISTQQLNQYDKNNAFMFFFEDFQQEVSVISDHFFGITETTNICINCQKYYNSQGMQNPICYNYQKFNCLIFPLEEVKKMKNNQMQSNNIQMNQNNIVNIYECFYYNQKTDLFTGANQNYCNLCKQLSDSFYTSKIYVSPNVLVLILNRGKDNVFNVKLIFTEQIDISDFVLQKEKPKIIYNLYGVITHIGQSGPSAHFMAACKSSVDNKWYRFNDAFANPITNIQKDVIEFGTPYILFYQKNN
jgi:ubiquitin carboxyl-terminal hydrolase 2/21